MRDERNFGLRFGEPLKLKSGVVVGLLTGMAFLLLPLVAEGNALPLASFTYFCGGGPASGPGGNNAILPGSVTCSSTLGFGQGQAMTTTDLMAGAGASASSPTSFAADGTATILYWAEVVGPSNV